MELDRPRPVTALTRPEATMRSERIFADCHIDLCQPPPDLFTSNASAARRDRMPYVTDSPKGKIWVSKGGAEYPPRVDGGDHCSLRSPSLTRDA
jgi:hypothetical protein